MADMRIPCFLLIALVLIGCLAACEGGQSSVETTKSPISTLGTYPAPIPPGIGGATTVSPETGEFPGPATDEPNELESDTTKRY